MEVRNEVDIAAAGPPKPAALAHRPKVVVCMTNHNRPDCARINQEIIKLNYAQPWPIVHACSDPAYQPHMEDVLVRCQPRSFIEGALNLLRQSCRAAVEIYHPEYLLHVEADTWVFDQRVIQRYVDALDRQPDAFLAASTWSTDQRVQWRRLRHPFAKLKLGAARVLNALGSDFGVKRKQTLSSQFFIARNDARFFSMLDGIQPTLENTLEYDFHQAFVQAFGKRGGPHQGTRAGASGLSPLVSAADLARAALAGTAAAACGWRAERRRYRSVRHSGQEGSVGGVRLQADRPGDAQAAGSRRYQLLQPWSEAILTAGIVIPAYAAQRNTNVVTEYGGNA